MDDSLEIGGDGTYSSAFMDDTDDFDPPLGEQGSLLRPYADWVDCSPPPWACSLVPGAVPTYNITLAGVTNGFCGDCTKANGTFDMVRSRNCEWEHQMPLPMCGGDGLWRMEALDASGYAGAGAVLVILFGPIPGWLWEKVVVWKGKTVTLDWVGFEGGNCGSVPAAVTVRPGSGETDVPLIGSISWDAGTDAVPANYLLCDGSAVSRATYSLLWGRLGATYGPGDGSTTFNLPDLRDRAAVGSGSTLGATGASGGALTHTLLIGEIPAPTVTITDPGHVHAVTDPGHVHGLTDPGHVHAVTDPQHHHAIGGGNFAVVVSSGGTLNQSGTGGSRLSFAANDSNAATGITIVSAVTGATVASQATGLTVDSVATGITATASGGGGSHSIVQPYLALRPLIYAGV